MLAAPLLWTIAGLAALDSLNPATIAGVTLILLAPLHRPGLTAAAYVAGAYLVVLAVGTGLFLGSAALGDVVDDAAAWVRRGALLLAAVVLTITALRRLRTRTRRAVVLPAWLGPWTAALLGVLVTGADLPNVFPYLIAIERLNAAGVPAGTGVLVLVLYSLVYCLPCLLLLAAGLVWRRPIQTRLQRLYQRLGGKRVQRRSLPIAVGLLVLAAIVAVVALTI